MRAFNAFLRKEFLESFRSGKLLFLAILFVVFGIMNPAIAKLTPWLMELLSDELSESGMIIGAIEVNALTSWTQFFKNIPMALIVFVLIYGSSFTKEYESETLILILTKGLARHHVVLAKTMASLSLWTLGYWICFGTTYAYNQYFWDNRIAKGLLVASFNWWLFGIFILCLVVFFSTIVKSYSTVLILTGACALLSYLLGMLPRIAFFMPSTLMNISSLLIGNETASDYIGCIITTLMLSFAAVGASIPIFNKKQL